MLATVLSVRLAGPEIAETIGVSGTIFHASASLAAATGFVTRTLNVWSAPLTPGAPSW